MHTWRLVRNQGFGPRVMALGEELLGAEKMKKLTETFPLETNALHLEMYDENLLALVQEVRQIGLFHIVNEEADVLGSWSCLTLDSSVGIEKFFEELATTRDISLEDKAPFLDLKDQAVVMVGELTPPGIAMYAFPRNEKERAELTDPVSEEKAERIELLLRTSHLVMANNPRCFRGGKPPTIVRPSGISLVSF